MADYINVTSLNRLARQVLAQCEPLNDLIVCGEISGFVRHYKSGHMYFTLKDETASVKSVMFRNSAQLLNFQPQNGMLVLAYGHATIYERDGAFQLYVDYMKPFGAGAAQMAFDALYKKLDAEGLFAPERRRCPSASVWSPARPAQPGRMCRTSSAAAGRWSSCCWPLSTCRASKPSAASWRASAHWMRISART